MSEKTRYSKEELKEFEQIINEKLEKARNDLKKLQSTMQKENENLTNTNIKIPDNSAEVEQRDNINQLISRQNKFINHLERALGRIRNGTYGICVVTGQLIDKKRLRIVPHTTHSVMAKQNRDNTD